MLTKSTDCQSDEKVCKSRKQKLFPVFLLFWAIFAFAGFASALTPQILNLSLGRFSLAETAKSAGSVPPATSAGFQAGNYKKVFLLRQNLPTQKTPRVHAAGSACQKTSGKEGSRSAPVSADAGKQ